MGFTLFISRHFTSTSVSFSIYSIGGRAALNTAKPLASTFDSAVSTSTQSFLCDNTDFHQVVGMHGHQKVRE